ncbi:MAG: hypothetical protein LUO93_11735 [Methanomicrobiales archaeon]|nr:hypothetical protein [Methanomicrobiales archaeon]
MVQRRNLSLGITVNLDNYENLRLEVSGEVCTDGDAEELIAYLDSILSRLGRGTPETAEKVDSYRKRVLSLPSPPAVSGTSGGVASMPGGIPREPAAPAPSLTATPAPAPEAAPSTPLPPEERRRVVPPPVSPVKEAVLPSTGRKETVGKKETALPSTSPEIKKPSTPAPSPAPRKEIPLPAKKEAAVPPVPAVKKESPAPVVSPKPAPVPAPAGSAALPKEEAFSCERCGEPITPVQRKLSRMFQNKDLCKKCLQQL